MPSTQHAPASNPILQPGAAVGGELFQQEAIEPLAGVGGLCLERQLVSIMNHREALMQDYQNFINGKFVASSGKDRIEVTNPSTGQPICTVPESTEADVDAALSAAEAAQREWARGPPSSAAKRCGRRCRKIRQNVEPLARDHHRGAGQDPAAWRAWRSPSPPTTSTTWPSGRAASKARSSRATARARPILLFRQPIGVIGGILPWNFPFFLIARKAAPALVTGNTIVIKPSEETPHNAVKFCELAIETDLPPGVINIVHGRGPTVGKALASSPARRA